MPVYEYECTKCGRAMEETQKISDEPLTTCPACKGKLRRLVSLTSFHLKGSGWYATDYKDKKQTKAKTKAKEGDTADTKSEETSTA
ncbi:MAG: FmdB family transcriptional regulator [Deltaproteobacteria bacterium RBG_16_54_18]|nr:MAG: FmdB family transcriptional regulator [Deltaproteobacteria bacterium RBG_16_54_18]